MVILVLIAIIIILLIHNRIPLNNMELGKTFVTPKDLGEHGEQCLISRLTMLPGYKHILHHVYIPCGKGTTEIDVVLISEKGIGVFENKHYSGVVNGNYSDKYWCHLFNGKSYNIYSPVYQNNGHIRAIKVLDGIGSYVNSIYGIVTFSNRKEFTVNRLNRDRDTVCHISQICEIVQKRDNVLNIEEINRLYQVLLPFTNPG